MTEMPEWESGLRNGSLLAKFPASIPALAWAIDECIHALDAARQEAEDQTFARRFSEAGSAAIRRAALEQAEQAARHFVVKAPIVTTWADLLALREQIADAIRALRGQRP